MCACAFKFGNPQILATQGFTDIISGASFASGQTYSDFMFYRCISEPKFLQALSTVKNGNTTLDKSIKTPEDVKELAKFVDEGNDVKTWNVNIKSLLGAIKFNQKELSNAQCKIAFSEKD